MLRMKSTLQQVRTQCANDIRKRDIQMQKLKQHLTGMQRGRREGLGVSTITITPFPSTTCFGRAIEGGEGLDSPEYTLKQETTEFLTGLCQNLSDENDSLISLARNTIETLRSLQGLPMSPLLTEETKGRDKNSGESETIGSSSDNDLVNAPLVSYETLAVELESVLEHLRTLLTNPSFVPIEEVEARDEEIVKLREGWIKMECRWKEALIMMDGWRKRMVDGGDSVNLEELKVGLGLGKSIAGGQPPQIDTELGDISIESERDDEMDEDGIQHDGVENSPDIWLDHDMAEAVTQSRPRRSKKALKETTGNPRRVSFPRKVSFKDSPTPTSMANSDDTELDEMVLVQANQPDTVKTVLSDNIKSRIPRQVS
jgi:hypothetical protein